VCCKPLQLKHHYLRSGLCDKCFYSCEKACRTCDATLALHELHWGSALCDSCYGSLPKRCFVDPSPTQTRATAPTQHLRGVPRHARLRTAPAHGGWRVSRCRACEASLATREL